VALNIFTNYFNHTAGTEIDFPHVNTDLTRLRKRTQADHAANPH
jgi:hypothetical protein